MRLMNEYYDLWFNHCYIYISGPNHTREGKWKKRKGNEVEDKRIKDGIT